MTLKQQEDPMQRGDQRCADCGGLHFGSGKTCPYADSRRLCEFCGCPMTMGGEPLAHECQCAITCAECSHPVASHDPMYGCEVEHGDGVRAGREVEEALGPCGCRMRVAQRLCDFKLEELKCGLPVGHRGAHKNAKPSLSSGYRWEGNVAVNLAAAQAENARLREALVNAAIPLEAIKLAVDWELSPAIMTEVNNVVEGIRALLYLPSACTNPEPCEGNVNGRQMFCKNCLKLLSDHASPSAEKESK